MPPSHLRSLLRIMSRRMSKSHREATASLLRRGAAIIDPTRFAAAWDASMPADSFNATHYQTKG